MACMRNILVVVMSGSARWACPAAPAQRRVVVLRRNAHALRCECPLQVFLWKRMLFEDAYDHVPSSSGNAAMAMLDEFGAGRIRYILITAHHECMVAFPPGMHDCSMHNGITEGT